MRGLTAEQKQVGIASPQAWHLSRMVAIYDYDAYGGLRRADGAYAFVNPLRYSTKYQDNESGLVDFGRRFYDADPGRWLNRDPLGELGGANLYAYARNDPENRYDPDGRMAVSCNSAECGNAADCIVDEDPPKKKKEPKPQEEKPAQQPPAPEKKPPETPTTAPATPSTCSDCSDCSKNPKLMGTSKCEGRSACICVCVNNIHQYEEGHPGIKRANDRIEQAVRSHETLHAREKNCSGGTTPSNESRANIESMMALTTALAECLQMAEGENANKGEACRCLQRLDWYVDQYCTCSAESGWPNCPPADDAACTKLKAQWGEAHKGAKDRLQCGKY
jgi:RHS repeat-associated protein